jgi:membrane associated rhomboid family serine protease
MFPLRDHNRSETRPFLTYSIIALNVLVFLYQATLPEGGGEELVMEMGLKPAFVVGFLHGEKVVEYERLTPARDRFGRMVVVEDHQPVRVTFWNSLFPFLASMFLHGGIAHLLGNMWFLHIFGDNVEDRLGHGRYLFFYLLAGFAASLAQVVVSPDSPVPCVGASGAISGVLGAYAISFPSARVLSLVPLGFFIQLIEIPAVAFLFIWFGIQVLSGLLSQTGGGGVAWWAHIGGFLVGLLWVKLVPPRRPTSSPWGRVRDVDFRHYR